MSDWEAMQQADEGARIEETLRALEAAEKAGTPREHIITLAHECGVGSIYCKERA